jgi:rod shape-determining protein MreC
MKQIFSKGPAVAISLVFFCLLAVALLTLDAKTELLKPLRQHFLSLATPVYWLTSLPGRVAEWVDNSAVSRESLMVENAALRTENFVLQQKLQKMAGLIAENSRLSELLNSSQLIDDEVLIAQLMGASSDPRRQEMVLDKGSEDDVYVGQAVLDADGLAGQVTEVSAQSCRVMLIVDSNSAVPVQILRNGTRFIAEGTGMLHNMHLRHVAATADIVVGDVLVSSGLDQHYPPNYSVARVATIEKDPGQPFLIVNITPLAKLNRSRHFLLVRNQTKTVPGE